ncbi:MAG: DUF5596 domain-containing protein, partial [Clostridia bacterium]|nr:DUF5596 domain-containing protein [Clostridia bacterium]
MIKQLALQHQFPEDAAFFLQESYEKLIKAPCALEDLELAEKLFFKKYYGYKEIIKRLAEKSDVHEYSAMMVFLLLATRRTHMLYKQKNIPDKIFYDTMQDLKYKLFECRDNHGIWGTFVPDWYMGIFL